MSKTVPDGQGGSVTTVFVCDGQQVVAEYVANTAPTSPDRKFVYATYIDEPVVMIDRTALGSVGAGTDELFYYHRNSLYSVVAMTDTGGSVVERHAFEAYGAAAFLDANATPLNPQASTIGNSYLYTGRRLDPETSLHYYRARYYDSASGRFLGRDPAGLSGSINLYEYAQDDPLDKVDPTGRATEVDTTTEVNDPSGEFKVRFQPREEGEECCASEVTVNYWPTPAEKSRCSRIWLEIATFHFEGLHWYPDYFHDWHPDYPTHPDDLEEWPKDNSHRAGWQDKPGGDGFRSSPWCPWIGAKETVDQRWEGCAWCENAATRQKELIGCVEWSHLCVFSYQESPIYSLFPFYTVAPGVSKLACPCVQKCDVVRKGNGTHPVTPLWGPAHPIDW